MTQINTVSYLESQGVSKDNITAVLEFRKNHNLTEEKPVPSTGPFIGAGTLQIAVATLLANRNLLLVGPKSSGKNVLTRTLSWVFGQELYEVPGHAHADAAWLLGEKTLGDNHTVVFEKARFIQAYEQGKFVDLDEVNTLRPELATVLHGALDDRQAVDVPGYGLVHRHPASRVMATMNYGYAGTAEMNEAFADRFITVHVDALSPKELALFLQTTNEGLNSEVASQLGMLFTELQGKAQKGEITTASVSIRGIIDGLRLARYGVSLSTALLSSVAGKSFDDQERTAVSDVIMTRIGKNAQPFAA